MLKFIIYDDQELELNLLSEHIKTVCTERQMEFKVYKYQNQEDVIDYSNRNKGRRNIYLLDILSQDGAEAGLKIAESIRRSDKTSYIVFVSGHPEYVFLSLKKQPFDFILKPYDFRMIETLIERISNHFDAMYNEARPYFYFNSGQVSNKIYIRDITYCEKESNVLVIHTLKGIYKGYMSFKEALSFLGKYGFIVCHKSYMVNPSSPNIECILRNEGKIIFKNGEICFYSRKYKKEFLDNVVRCV